MYPKFRKDLDQKATKILRGSGYTWAGNIPTQELIENRIMDRELKVPGGMTKKRPGIIGLKLRRN